MGMGRAAFDVTLIAAEQVPCDLCLRKPYWFPHLFQSRGWEGAARSVVGLIHGGFGGGSGNLQPMGNGSVRACIFCNQWEGHCSVQGSVQGKHLSGAWCGLITLVLLMGPGVVSGGAGNARFAQGASRDKVRRKTGRNLRDSNRQPQCQPRDPRWALIF